MSRAGGSARKHPLVMPLAIIAVVFVIVSLAAILGPNWVRLYVLPVVVIVGVGYGVIILMVLWVVKGLPTPPTATGGNRGLARTVHPA